MLGLTGVEIMQKNAHAAEQDGDSAHPESVKVPAAQGRRTPIEDQVFLVRRLRHGEHAAAAELVDKCYERIYLFMRAMGHDRQMSEDLTQDTFLRAWKHIGQLRDGRALNGWLFRIAGNVSRLHWRRHKHEGPVGSDSIEATEAGIDGLGLAGEKELLARLHQAVTELPWKLRQAIVLHYMQQLTIAEAAEAAHVRQGTLKSRLNRALGALRKDLVDE
jgi:RNA polymerase sigma factor (sigma-70 family)